MLGPTTYRKLNERIGKYFMKINIMPEAPGSVRNLEVESRFALLCTSTDDDRSLTGNTNWWLTGSGLQVAGHDS